MNDNPLNASSRFSSQSRLAGVIVLVVGLACAGLVYGLGTRGSDLSENPSMLQYNKPTERQMRMLYGKPGQLIEDISNSLKQPGTQALLIAAITATISGVCFYVSKLGRKDE